MTPSIDDRLASIVRALTEVILPHLPPEASLAQEQAHLAIGHIQIIRAQLDAAPAFEREELDDAIAIARDIAGKVTGGSETAAALAELAKAAAAADGSDVRGQRQAIHDAIDVLVKAASSEGAAGLGSPLAATILAHERVRTRKDREWFAPFGFDTL